MSGKLAINGGTPVRTEPFPAWPAPNPREEKLLLDVYRSGNWGRGKITEEFEEKFAAAHDCKYAVAVTSGTVALRIALLAAGIEEGDEVIVPPFTFMATATAVVECNATPIFADIDRSTYTLDPAKVAEAITPRTKAIIPVHISGTVANMDRINELARQHNLVVIEDCAQSPGSVWKGRKPGSLGDMGCFSFQWSKNLSAGEGGVITTNNETLYLACKSVHNCGRSAKGGWYDHHTIAGNYRITEFQSALLLSQLEKLDERTRHREANGRYLAGKVGEIPGLLPAHRSPEQEVHAYHVWFFEYGSNDFGGLGRIPFAEAVQAEGIPAGPGYSKPLNLQPLFVNKQFGPYAGCTKHRPDLDYGKLEFPVCATVCAINLRFLHHILLADRSAMDDIVAAFAKVREHHEELLEAEVSSRSKAF